MFHLNRQPILWMIAHRFRSNLYIPDHNDFVASHSGVYPSQGLPSGAKSRLRGRSADLMPPLALDTAHWALLTIKPKSSEINTGGLFPPPRMWFSAHGPETSSIKRSIGLRQAIPSQA